MFDTYKLVHLYGFSAEYIDKLPPADRAVYLMFADKEEKAKEEANDEG